MAGNTKRWAGGRGRPPKDAKFHVRFTDAQGKRRWSQPFNTPQEAAKNAFSIAVAAHAASQGLTVTNAGRTSVKIAVEKFLKLHRNDRPKTIQQYENEGVIALPGLAQFETMGDHETRIDLAALDSIKQALPIMLFVALSSSHGEAAVHERTHGELIDEPAVDSNDGDDSSITASHDGFTQRDRPITLGHHGLLNAIVRVDEARSWAAPRPRLKPPKNSS
jgi:hypothetical protein